MRFALALLVTVGTQGAHAAPAAALTELRALLCCANTCHPENPVSGAKRCCPVLQSAADVAAFSAVAHPEPPAQVATLPPQTTLPAATVPPVLERSYQPPQRAGPLFLLATSLRL